MKLELDFEDLEHQWKTRQFDLFPWFDGLFTLLRQRESILRETKKRLSSSTQATMVQFLSSDDHENALIAKETIKDQTAGAVLPILLYSLEKVTKNDYPHRIMECLLDFDIDISFGYLLGYLYLRNNIKEKVFQIFNEIFPIKNIFPDTKDSSHFLIQLFQALNNDLKQRMPSSGKLEKIEDFDSINLDLKIILLIFQKTWQGENARIVENEMKKIGQDVIVSFRGLPLKNEKGDVLFEQLSEIILYIAIMRLEADKSFLKGLHTNLKSLTLKEEEQEEILEKSDAALAIIGQPDKTINEILEQFESPIFFDNLSSLNQL
ncbi:MAG: hypothetical protein ACMUIU_05245 [bacterium]